MISHPPCSHRVGQTIIAIIGTLGNFHTGLRARYLLFDAIHYCVFRTIPMKSWNTTTCAIAITECFNNPHALQKLFKTHVSILKLFASFNHHEFNFDIVRTKNALVSASWGFNNTSMFMEAGIREKNMRTRLQSDR